jgi:hypothetical protein
MLVLVSGKNLNNIQKAKAGLVTDVMSRIGMPDSNIGSNGWFQSVDELTEALFAGKAYLIDERDLKN